jgi:hypothetical protein
MPRQTAQNLSRIPICTSDFLQDVTIELGKRLKTVRHRGGRLEFRTKISEHAGEELEYFDATLWLGRDSYIQVVVLENGEANYMYCVPRERKQGRARYIGFVVKLTGWEPSQVANLIRDSLVDEIGIREVWQKLNPTRQIDTIDRSA